MNLKEAFRYQSFLSELLNEATTCLYQLSHCMKITKIHHMNKVNPDVEDVTEQIDNGDFPDNDKVISFMCALVDEREKLSKAIKYAKTYYSDIDIDSEVATNKFRQSVAHSIKGMLKYTPSQKTERGSSFKFNVEGNQTPYYYDIDVIYEDAFDRKKSKEIAKKLLEEADKSSEEIDKALVETAVMYEPMFDVNDSFDDIMEWFGATEDK